MSANKSVVFSVKKTDGTTIEGYLINQKQNSSIYFSTNDIPSGKTISNDIKDVGNFIAAYVKKMSSLKTYVSIIIDGVETEILWVKPVEEEKFTIKYSHDKLEDKLLTFNNGLVQLTDINNKLVFVPAVNLGFKEVKVPKKGYTTNPVLNEIFALNNFPFDYNKELNNSVEKIIKRYKQKNYSENIYFDNNGNSSTIKSKYYTFVIPAKYFK